MEMATGGTRVTIRGQGVYDFRKQTGRLKVLLPQDPAGAAEHRPITELLSPGALFMKNRGAGVPADKWVRVETAGLTDGNLVTGGATDPYAAAELLRGARSVTYVGKTEVAGISVRHYRGTADLGTAARDASAGRRAGAEGGGEGVRHHRGPVRRLPRRRGAAAQGPAPVQLRQRTADGHRRGRLDAPAVRLRQPRRRTAPGFLGHLRREDRGVVASGEMGKSIRSRSFRGGLEMALPCHARCVGRSLL